MDPAIGQSGILWGTLAGAVIVTAGGFYALFFALGRLNDIRWLNLLSYASYLILVLATVVLAQALLLKGFWLLVIAVMLLGYFFAPRAIWWLCVGTHQHSDSKDINTDDNSTSPRALQ